MCKEFFLQLIKTTIQYRCVLSVRSGFNQNLTLNYIIDFLYFLCKQLEEIVFHKDLQLTCLFVNSERLLEIAFKSGNKVQFNIL